MRPASDRIYPVVVVGALLSASVWLVSPPVPMELAQGLMASPTGTPTASATPTPSPTGTETATVTPSETATATGTASVTPTGTGTTTRTPTAPPTPTATASATATAAPRPPPTTVRVASPTPLRSTPRPPNSAAPAPPAPAQPVPDGDWSRSDVVFVFIPGYGASLSAFPDPFGKVKRALVQRGWPPSQFVPFSYAGGRMLGDRWVPTDYGCDRTTSGIARAAGTLGQLVADYHSVNPRARFVHIGHSLGGAVAWRYLYEASRRGALSIASVGILSIDAPVRGILGRRAAILSALHFTCGSAQSPTITELIDFKTSGWVSRWTEAGNWADARGVWARSVGNPGDCMYIPRACGIALAGDDDPDDQLVPGYEIRIPVDGDQVTGLGPTHSALLSLDRYADQIAALAEMAARPRRLPR